MTISSQHRVSAASDVFFRMVQDEAIVLNVSTEQYLGLNATGARMWVVLHESSDIGAACERLGREYKWTLGS